MNYEIRLIPKQDSDGDTYWTAYFPAIPECVGGGDTPTEAMNEAYENLEIYLDYLKSQKKVIPTEYKENIFNGRIALRLPKTMHKKITEFADKEGVSTNTLIICAIEHYTGLKQFDYKLEDKIKIIQEETTQSLALQFLNYDFNRKIAEKWNLNSYMGDY